MEKDLYKEFCPRRKKSKIYQRDHVVRFLKDWTRGVELLKAGGCREESVLSHFRHTESLRSKLECRLARIWYSRIGNKAFLEELHRIVKESLGDVQHHMNQLNTETATIEYRQPGAQNQ